MKRIPVKQLTLCLLIVISSLSANAQAVSCYFPDNYVIDAGSTFTADIRVNTFVNIGGCGLSVNWNPEVLRFKEIVNLGVTPSELGGFNDIKAVSHGELGFVWLSPNATMGVTLPDSAILFSITFDVLGSGGDTTSIRFSDTPVPSEFYTPEPKIIPTTFSNAGVSVTGTSNTYYNSAPKKISLYPPVPNPFYENTLVKIDLQQAAQTTIRIVDQLGKVLYEDQQYLSAGLQTIPIFKEIFDQSGTYYCLLQASDFRVMQKLVFINR